MTQLRAALEQWLGVGHLPALPRAFGEVRDCATLDRELGIDSGTTARAFLGEVVAEESGAKLSEWAELLAQEDDHGA